MGNPAAKELMPISLVGSSKTSLLFTAETRRRRERQSGVTLIEMIIVVAIIGLMVAVAFPSIAAGLDSVRMSTATGEVAAFLNAAVNRSERRQEAVALV